MGDQTVRRRLTADETVRANRRWWDHESDAYQAEHGSFLRDDGFIWCPEGLDEATEGLLGPVSGQRILEVGCGAAQCSRWLIDQGAHAVGIDLSSRQLEHARRIDAAAGPTSPVPIVQADAGRLPFRDRSFDLACSAYGALPFVADSAAVLAEVARVLRPGGRWVFSVSHPLRWCFPDDPGPAGLVAQLSYFDRRAYVEQDESGAVSYAEHHRTVGDWVRQLAAAGFRLMDVVEPEWPDGHDREWGGWSPLRGEIIPGTAIFVAITAPDRQPGR